MVHLETRLLGQKWTKKWRSRLFEDEIAEFLDEIQEHAKHIARYGCYLHFGGVSVQDKTIQILSWNRAEKKAKVLKSLRGSKHVKNFEIFWINNNKSQLLNSLWLSFDVKNYVDLEGFSVSSSASSLGG